MTINGNLIIIGSGIAGISAARAARRTYPHIRISVLSDDPDGFYNRIAVEALAVRKRQTADLFTLAPHCFENERIEARFGEMVKSIDRQLKLVYTASGEALAYDRLILATGASPWGPPISGIDSPGVHFLWTMNDARRLSAKLAGSSDVAVIGGGILGVEAALDIAGIGKKVHLIEAANGLLEQHLPDSISIALKNELQSDNISVYTKANVSSIQPHNGRISLRTSSVAITCDTVLISAGVRPNTILAADAGLKTADGIVVNDHMLTSDSSIFACGNCVTQPQGGALLWNPAKQQGETAGENAFKIRRTFQSHPFPLHLKSNRISLFTMGNPAAVSKQTTCISQKTATGEKRVYVTAKGRICYAVFFGDVDNYYSVEKLIRNQVVLGDEITADASLPRILTDVLPEADDAGYIKTSWVCSVCGFVHEGDTAPGVCPVCNVGRDQFLAA